MATAVADGAHQKIVVPASADSGPLELPDAKSAASRGMAVAPKRPS
jgi:hypothetical protein